MYRPFRVYWEHTLEAHPEPLILNSEQYVFLHILLDGNIKEEQDLCILKKWLIGPFGVCLDKLAIQHVPYTPSQHTLNGLYILYIWLVPYRFPSYLIEQWNQAHEAIASMMLAVRPIDYYVQCQSPSDTFSWGLDVKGCPGAGVTPCWPFSIQACSGIGPCPSYIKNGSCGGSAASVDGCPSEVTWVTRPRMSAASH